MAYAINEYNFWSNPKVREAGKDAALMYLAGNSYCNEFMTDGFIAQTIVPVLANLAFQTNPEKAIKALVDNHLWIKVANGYKVHDYLGPQKHRRKLHRIREEESYFTRLRFQSVRKTAWGFLIQNGEAKCAYCGSTDNLQIDHIKPIARGGTNDFDNLQILCKSCNCRKSDRYEE